MDSQIPRERILKVAAEVFSESGFAGARVDQIASRARVNKALLYYHIGNKQQLYSTVVRSLLEIARAKIAAVLAAEATPRERIRSVARAIAVTAAELPHLPSILLREIASGGGNLDDDLLRDLGRLLQSIASIYREGTAAKDFRPVDPLITHMATAGSLLLLIGSRPLRARLRQMGDLPAPSFREEDPIAIADELATLLLEGVRVRKESS